MGDVGDLLQHDRTDQKDQFVPTGTEFVQRSVPAGFDARICSPSVLHLFDAVDVADFGLFTHLGEPIGRVPHPVPAPIRRQHLRYDRRKLHVKAIEEQL